MADELRLDERIEELEALRSDRLRLLAIFALVTAMATFGTSVLFALFVVGGDDPFSIFIVAMGLLAGPAALAVVLVWVAGVRNFVADQFAAEIVVPGLRERFDQFRYDSREGLDDHLEPSALFPESVQQHEARHRIEIPSADATFRTCAIEVGPPFSLSKLFSDDSSSGFSGLFAVAEPAFSSDGRLLVDDSASDLARLFRQAVEESEQSLETVDLDGLTVESTSPTFAEKLPTKDLRRLVDDFGSLALSIRDETLYLTVDIPAPTLRTDPREPVVEADDVEQFFDALAALQTCTRAIQQR